MAELVVEPSRSRIDQAVRVAVTGLVPGRQVRIRASTRDGSGVPWASEVTVVADDDGTVDLTRDAPVDGGYRGVDPVGLLWSMRPTTGKADQFFARRRPTPLTVEFEVLDSDKAGDGAGDKTGDEAIATGRCVRDFGNEQVTARDADGDIVGRLFAPVADGPHPAVLMFGGSDGGVHDHAASLLASHGFTVLSLAYFGVEDRPKTLDHIELTYFLDAIRWLADQPEAGPGGVGLIGLSRGGELALQIGVLSDRVACVVAGSPAHARQAGLPGNRNDFTQPAWVLDGKPLPFVPGKFSFRTFVAFFAAFMFGRPVRQRAMFLRLNGDAEKVAPAVIEVERIGAPILVVTGADDQLWPSSWFADRIARRRRDHGRDSADRYLDLPGAGHFVCFPYGLPSLPPMLRISPVGRLTFDFGGTAEANAAAAGESWRAILEFLRTAY